MKCQHGIYRFNCSTCNPIRTKIYPREDLLMLTEGRYPDDACPKTNAEEMRGLVFAKVRGGRLGNAYLSMARGFESPKEGHKVILVSQKRYLMDSNYNERRSMIAATAWCPKNAKVFVGGLGLGLILLYLAKTGKTRSVTVAEVDPLVVKLVEPRVRRWLAKRYPSFSFEVKRGDAIELVQNETWDWVFMDIWSGCGYGKRADGTYGHIDEPLLLKAKAAAKAHAKRVTCWNERKIVSRRERRARRSSSSTIDLSKGLAEIVARGRDGVI